MTDQIEKDITHFIREYGLYIFLLHLYNVIKKETTIKVPYSVDKIDFDTFVDKINYLI
jgi:hypothetical protein